MEAQLIEPGMFVQGHGRAQHVEVTSDYVAVEFEPYTVHYELGDVINVE